MSLRPLAAAACCAFATAAWAQAEPDVIHDGRWTATIETAQGEKQTAQLVVREFGGEWIGAAGRSAVTGSACAGKKIPITVQASTADALAFTVWGKQLSPQCADLTIVLKAAGDDAFEGRIESVGTLRIAKRSPGRRGR